MEEDVGDVGAVAEVADLDDEVGADVASDGIAEPALAAGGGEVVDEIGAGGEEGVEAVMQGAVGDGDGEVGLTATGFALEDDGAALGDEVRGEQGADGGEAQRRLVGEVELLDGAEEGEAGGAHGAVEAGLAAVRDLLGDEDGEEVAIRPRLLVRRARRGRGRCAARWRGAAA